MIFGFAFDFGSLFLLFLPLKLKVDDHGTRFWNNMFVENKRFVLPSTQKARIPLPDSLSG